MVSDPTLAPGAWRFRFSTIEKKKDEKVTSASRPDSCTDSRTRSSTPACLTSSTKRVRVPYRSNVSDRSGTRAPANSAPNHAPASNSRTTAHGVSDTMPVPFVVRLRSASWSSTSRPSHVACTSVSMASTPMAIARSKLAQVFSGASAAAPR